MSISISYENKTGLFKWTHATAWAQKPKLADGAVYGRGMTCVLPRPGISRSEPAGDPAGGMTVIWVQGRPQSGRQWEIVGGWNEETNSKGEIVHYPTIQANPGFELGMHMYATDEGVRAESGFVYRSVASFYNPKDKFLDPPGFACSTEISSP